ncbi:MAG: hypothetical protein Kow0031_10810 [Anaerolineae bacterium]
MDTISRALISALTMQASSPAKQQAVATAVENIKQLLADQPDDYGDVLEALDQLEKKPDSEARQAVLEEEVLVCGLNHNTEVLKLANSIITRLFPTPPGSTRTRRRPAPIVRPPRPSGHVDREAELKTLVSMLQPATTIAICGPTGIGKGDLAAAAVWEIAPKKEVPPQFPDGVVYYNMHGQPRTDIVLEEIARFFGQDPTPSPYDAVEKAFTSRRALLMLEGTNRVDDLPGLLAVRGQCCFLLVSEECPPEVSGHLQISPLPLNHAVAMLNAFGAEADEDVAGQICDLLGRMPLAIRLAGCYLADSKHNSRVFLDWLLNSTEMASLTPGERQHKAVELMLAHILAQVNETARQSLAVASLMAFTRFDPEIIAKTLTIQPNQGLLSTIRGLFRQEKQVQSIPYVLQSLREMVGYGLLDWTPEGYIFSHPAIYDYARVHLSPPAHAIRRLATLYMAMAWEQNDAPTGGANLLDTNRPHIMKVMEECVKSEEWAAAHGLAAAVEDYLDRHGYLGDRITVNEVGLIAAWQLGRPSEGAWLGNLGDTYRTMGHAKWAIEHFEKALVTAQHAGDRHAEGNSLGNLGLAYRDLGQIEQALQYLKQAEAIFEEIHSPSAGLVKDWLAELEDWEED